MIRSRTKPTAEKTRQPGWSWEFPELWEQYLDLVMKIRETIRLTHGLETRVSQTTGIPISRISAVINNRVPSLGTAMRIASALEKLGAWDRRVTLRIEVSDGQGGSPQVSA